MKGIKWGIMDGGTLDLDKSVLTFMRDMGKLITIPIWQGYIETPEHKIVCDTSFDIENKNWRVKLAGGKYQPGIEFWGERQSSEQRIENQLKKIGLTPDDIDIVILTHLHFDHSGQNKKFKKAKFYINKYQMDWAMCPGNFQQSAYSWSDLTGAPSKQPDRQTLDMWNRIVWTYGDCEVCPGVKLISTPGHTPGHQTILIESDPPTIMCGDAIYMEENWEEEWPPGYVYDAQLASESICRVRMIAKEIGAKHYVSHDAESFAKWKKLPAFEVE